MLDVEATTVNALLVVSVRVPEGPIRVTGAAPVMTVLLTLCVSTLVVVVGLVANADVTPRKSRQHLSRPRSDGVLNTGAGAVTAAYVATTVLRIVLALRTDAEDY
jgi:hypothetical protein